MVLSTFLDMIAAKQSELNHHEVKRIPSLAQLPYQTLTVHSQFTEIPQRTGHLISIVMTDENWAQSVPIQASERRARFDGLLCFDPTWVLVIENKPRVNNIWEEQLHIPLPPGAEIEISRGLVCLVWREVIQVLGSLIQRGLCHGIEAQLIEDFLAFTDRHFPYLNPYTTLSLCKGNDYLLKRRCDALLESLGLGEAQHDRGYKDYVRLPVGPADRVFLFPEGDGGLTLEIFPADTVKQAREFFSSVDRDALLGLADKKWSVEPNLHFSFMTTHLQWSTSKVPVSEYLDYWTKQPKVYGRVEKQDLLGRLSAFVVEGLMTQDDVSDMDRHFMQTRRSFANIIPGLKVAFQIPAAQAIDLDDRGQLGTYLKSLMGEALDTWGQSISPKV